MHNNVHVLTLCVYLQLHVYLQLSLPTNLIHMYMYVGVNLALNQTVYSVSEEDGLVEICADLEGELERSIDAEILLIQASASG